MSHGTPTTYLFKANDSTEISEIKEYFNFFFLLEMY